MIWNHKMGLQFYMPFVFSKSMCVQLIVDFIPSSYLYKRLMCNQDLIGPNAEKLCNYRSQMSKMTEHNNQIMNTL